MEKLVNREIEFKAYSKTLKMMSDPFELNDILFHDFTLDRYVLKPIPNASKHILKNYVFDLKDCAILQFTGLCDKNGKKVFEGDILQFSNKAEWYKSEWRFGKTELKEVLENHIKYPYERRLIQIPDSYEWLLSGEIQEYWENIGNIFKNSELLES